MQRKTRSGWSHKLKWAGETWPFPALLYIEGRGMRMEAIVKAVVIGVLTVVIAALNQSGEDKD